MTAVGQTVLRRPVRGRAHLWAAFLATAVALGAGGGALVHVLASSRTSAPPLRHPELHGQVSWSAGARPAPVFPLRAAGGGTRASSSLRGRTVVVVFERAGCGAACASLRAEVAQIVRGLPHAERPAVVAVGGPGALAAADPAAVRRSFGVPPRVLLVYLLDRHGFERTGYLFPFPPAFVQGDLRTLAREAA